MNIYAFKSIIYIYIYIYIHYSYREKYTCLHINHITIYTYLHDRVTYMSLYNNKHLFIYIILEI